MTASPLHWYQLSSLGNPQKLLRTAVYRWTWTHKRSFKITAWGHSSFSHIYLFIFCSFVPYIWWRGVTKYAIVTQWGGDSPLRCNRPTWSPFHVVSVGDFDCSWKNGSMLWMQTKRRLLGGGRLWFRVSKVIGRRIKKKHLLLYPFYFKCCSGLFFFNNSVNSQKQFIFRFYINLYKNVFLHILRTDKLKKKTEQSDIFFFSPWDKFGLLDKIRS